jgi:hypothetical protein
MAPTILAIASRVTVIALAKQDSVKITAMFEINAARNKFSILFILGGTNNEKIECFVI